MLLTNDNFRKEVVSQIDDPILTQFWDDLPTQSRDRYELISSTLNKISPFITDRAMRNIIGQTKNTFNLQKIMDEGKILFVNLSKGDLGEDNSSLLGSVLVNLVLMAALKRRSIPKDQRRPFHLIVDEFQNFANESFSVLQSEARKYAVDVVVAHQFRDQLPEELKGLNPECGQPGCLSSHRAGWLRPGQPVRQHAAQARYSGRAGLSGIQYQGVDFLLETSLNTGEGKLYQEVELPRRPYNDVEAEMANLLSILPNYEAWCHLIYDPRSRKEDGRPKLVEYHIETEEMGKKEHDKDIAAIIREQSRNLASTRDEVEKEIRRRSHGEIKSDEAETQEKISK